MAGRGGGPVALQVLMFFPRGGSAQVVRSLARTIAGGPSGWRPRIVSGSLGATGEAGNAATFFAGLDLVAVPYDAAAAAPDPMRASPPFHPSYEDRPGAPDPVLAALDDDVYGHLVEEWTRILLAPSDPLTIRGRQPDDPPAIARASDRTTWADPPRGKNISTCRATGPSRDTATAGLRR